MSVLRVALRLGLAALMIWAGVLKLLDPGAFTEEIVNYRLLSELAPLLAATLPAMEIVAGVALAVGRGALRRGAALLTLALLVVFTVAVTTARVRGIDLSCGCFGKGGGPITTWTIVRDLAFVAWATIVLRLG